MEQENKKIVRVALAGNPNVGKSTLFNTLTGMNQHTGNWPGKTVGSAVGRFSYKDTDFVITDLPGTYSLISTSTDEEIARDFICSDERDVTVAVADACCLERNLALVLQIRSITPNMILCVNLLDEARKKKITVDLKKLSDTIGIPVVGTAARSKYGLNELRECLYSFKAQNEIVSSPDARNKIILEASPEDFIEKAKEIYRECVTEKSANTHMRDRRIDKIVTSKVFGFPIMLGLLGIVFFLTIAGANYPSQLLSYMFSALGTKLDAFCTYISMPESLHSALIDGIYRTLSNVIAVMLPPMAIFFPLFTLLEDFGYLPRIAFNMDRAFRRAHACGKQCLTMMMGFGCTVPAVMSARSMNNDRDRRFTIMLTPFMSCGAKVPIYALFTRAFFPGNQVWVMTGMYLMGILVAICAGLVLKRTVFHGDAAPFIMELPAYRLPTPANVLRQMWDKAKDFLQRAFTVIFLATLIVWFLQNFTFRLEMTSEIGESMLGKIAGLIAPVFAPAGFGSVEASTAVITGLMAKESVVSTLAVLSGVDAESAQMVSVMRQIFPSTLAAVSFLVFVLLYMPCVAAVAAMRREMESSRWAYGTIAAQTALAWTLATLVFQLGRLLGLG